MTGPRAENTSETVYMKGGGYYSSNALGTTRAINSAVGLVERAISGMDIADEDRPFSIADYGAADGGTSLDLFRKVIELVRARAPVRPIIITYNDLPRNDFSALFTIVSGENDSLGIRSYLEDYDNVFVTASGASFYQQVLPNDSVDFGFSATSFHWLSEKPGIVSNHIHSVGAAGEELEKYAVRAREDWQALLLLRAAELRRGGRLLFLNFCEDEEGRYLGNTGGVNMFDSFNSIWLELVAEGSVTKEEYTNAAFPQYYRNVEEFAAPFSEPDGETRKAGLSLNHIETRVIDCPFEETFGQTGDLESFAREYTATIRSWSESTFYNSLDPSRPADERSGTIDELYRKYERLVRRAPVGHGMAHVYANMVISKA